MTYLKASRHASDTSTLTPNIYAAGSSSNSAVAARRKSALRGDKSATYATK